MYFLLNVYSVICASGLIVGLKVINYKTCLCVCVCVCSCVITEANNRAQQKNRRGIERNKIRTAVSNKGKYRVSRQTALT